MRTMRKVRRGLERERREVRRRFVEEGGCLVARVESWEEASGGMDADCEDGSASFSSSFRRRRALVVMGVSCGWSEVGGELQSCCTGSAGVVCAEARKDWLVKNWVQSGP